MSFSNNNPGQFAGDYYDESWEDGTDDAYSYDPEASKSLCGLCGDKTLLARDVNQVFYAKYRFSADDYQEMTRNVFATDQWGELCIECLEEDGSDCIRFTEAEGWHHIDKDTNREQVARWRTSEELKSTAKRETERSRLYRASNDWVDVNID